MNSDSKNYDRLMKKKIRHILFTFLMCLPLLLAGGCVPRFTLNGSSINYDIYKTINISEFPIRAALVYPPLQQIFETKLMDAITKQTRLQIVDGNADMGLSGEITGYSLSPQSVGTDAYATETRLTITVRVKYTDNKVDNKTSDQSFSAYRQFSSSLMLTDVQEDLCNQISDELVNLIFNATLGDW